MLCRDETCGFGVGVWRCVCVCVCVARAYWKHKQLILFPLFRESIEDVEQSRYRSEAQNSEREEGKPFFKNGEGKFS